MKKYLVVLGGMLLMSSLSFADVQESKNSFTIDEDAQILKFGIKGVVKEPLAAWWKDNEFFGNKFLVYDVEDLTTGQNLPSIPPREIYVIVPYTHQQNRIKANISTTNMTVKHSEGSPTFTLPVKLKVKNGSVQGQNINIDSYSAAGDSKDVIDALAEAGLTGLGNYIDGEIIQIVTEVFLIFSLQLVLHFSSKGSSMA